MWAEASVVAFSAIKCCGGGPPAVILRDEVSGWAFKIPKVTKMGRARTAHCGNGKNHSPHVRAVEVVGLVVGGLVTDWAALSETRARESVLR